MLKDLIKRTVEVALITAGLERRRSAGAIILPLVGILAAGAAIGAGVGLAFAPLSGRGLRAEVGSHLLRMSKRVKRLPIAAQRAFNGAT